jgi:hypothetical protein
MQARRLPPTPHKRLPAATEALLADDASPDGTHASFSRARASSLAHNSDRRPASLDPLFGLSTPPISTLQLPEPLTGKTVKLADVAEGAKATLVMFGCVHCPFVVHLKGASPAPFGRGALP